MSIKFNYHARLLHLKSCLKQEGFSAFLVSRKERIRYLTGYRGDDEYLLATQRTNVLFTDTRYKEELKTTPFPFSVKIGHDKINDISDFLLKLRAKKVGFEESFVTYQLYTKLKKRLRYAILTPSQKVLDSILLIKDKDEIGAIKKATEITGKALYFLKKIHKIGRSEKSIAKELDEYMFTQGAEDTSFKTMVISGKRTAWPHAISGENKIKVHENLLIDLGAKIYGYNSDLTRIATLSKMKKRFRDVFIAVQTAQQEAIRIIRPGVRAAEIHNTIVKYFKRLKLKKYFMHASGHGVGIFVHEKPALNKNATCIMRPGMVFTVEPGIYIPEKFGIRLEDMILVTDKGCEVLSRDIPYAV